MIHVGSVATPLNQISGTAKRTHVFSRGGIHRPRNAEATRIENLRDPANVTHPLPRKMKPDTKF